MRAYLHSFLMLISMGLFAQQTVVSGKVTESATGTPVPFATVSFVGTSDGAITDFDGNFIAKTMKAVDSISVTYIGYIRRAKALRAGETQIINFQLDESLTSLDEVVVYAGENPAFEILRRVNDNKKRNDKRELEAYEYESYTRTEFDADHLSDRVKTSKVMSQITSVLDSIEQIAGEDGQPVLPLFISEAVSRFHFRKSPLAKHEKMIKTRISGVGITDGTLTSQVIGSSFQEYNFYQNWLNIVDKEFASPIADGGRLIYEYDLTDSLEVDGHFCYQLDFYPKQEQDLAFQGTMWITKDGYALKRIDSYVSDKSNLNFIGKIKLQQDLEQVADGAWLPSKTRVVIQMKPMMPGAAGFLGKFYVSNKDFVINQPKENEFYLNPISLDPDVRKSDENYWRQARHDSLTRTEEHVFAMIDSLKKIPRVRVATEAMKFMVTGYIKSGKIDIGPYTTFVGNNDIEGFRLGFGARTNLDFSDKWVFGGYFGYGFGDEEFKYSAYGYRILDRQPWTTIKYEQQKEVEQIWLLNENVSTTSLFYTLSRFGNLTQPFAKEKYRVSVYRQLSKGFNAEFSARHEQHDPLFDFNYYRDADRASTGSTYQISEATVDLRYGRDEVWVINDNERLSLGTIRSPLFKLNYTYGMNGVWGSDFEYHKLKASITKRVKLGVLGRSQFQLEGGRFFGQAPYSMLFNPIGNETPIYVGFAYNLMNYFEFSSDRYVELKYNHSFEGFLLNRIPLLKKMKLRAVASASALMGDLRQKNISISQYESDINGNPIYPFRQWESKPYVEVGYGVTNIVKVFSVQAFHRLSYLDGNVSKFGVKFRLDFQL